MEIYTIGFTQTTAQRFFERLAGAGIERLLDVRLNNTSQLAGFAKAKDLPYFLRGWSAPATSMWMFGLAHPFKAGEDEPERHWLQLNGLCLADRPVGDAP